VAVTTHRELPMSGVTVLPKMVPTSHLEVPKKMAALYNLGEEYVEIMVC